MKHLQVVAAIIIFEGKILCLQRAQHPYAYLSDKFEFPGGKVETGEHNEQALIREIKEELALDIQIQSKYCSIDHAYPDFGITLHCYICHISSEQHQLNVHQQSCWLYPAELDQLDWAAADIPAVEQLMQDY